jgi:hypothetical protein
MSATHLKKAGALFIAVFDVGVSSGRMEFSRNGRIDITRQIGTNDCFVQ